MKINFRRKLALLVALVMVLGSYSMFAQPLQVSAGDPPVEAVLAVPVFNRTAPAEAAPVAEVTPAEAVLPVPAIFGPVERVGLIWLANGSDGNLIGGELPPLSPTTTSVAITVQARWASELGGFVDVMGLVYDDFGLTPSEAAIRIVVLEGTSTHTTVVNEFGFTEINFDPNTENAFTLQIYAYYDGVYSVSLIVTVVPTPATPPTTEPPSTTPPATTASGGMWTWPGSPTTAPAATTAPSDEDGDVTVDVNDIAALIEYGQYTGVVVLNLTGQTNVALLYELVVAVAEAELYLHVELSHGAVSFNPVALLDIIYQANGADLTLSVVQLSTNDFQINLYANDAAIINIGGMTWVTLPFEGLNNPEVWMVTADGEYIRLTAFNLGNGTVTFTTSQLGARFFIMEADLPALPDPSYPVDEPTGLDVGSVDATPITGTVNPQTGDSSSPTGLLVSGLGLAASLAALVIFKKKQ